MAVIRAIQVVKIEGNVQWKAIQTRSGKWIGVCDAINLVLEADSLDELHSLIPEGLHLLLRDLVKDNEFDSFLREQGWSTNADRVPKDENVEFDLPWHLLVPGGKIDSARQAN